MNNTELKDSEVTHEVVESLYYGRDALAKIIEEATTAMKDISATLDLLEKARSAAQHKDA